MPVAYLGLGSNIGDKEGYITQALQGISQICQITKKSHLYQTEPVGKVKQDWFLNCVVEIETDMEPTRLLFTLQSIEQKLGRRKTIKNGPRTIDIDILFYGNRIVKTKNLIIPHPRVQERLFVLQPMMDLNPCFVHPVLKKTMQELYTCHPGSETVRFYK